MTTKAENKDVIDILADKVEDRKIQTAEIVDKIANEHPEANIASKGEWWVPSINFSYDLKVRALSSLGLCLNS